MKIAYFDCFSGISGDMILGALVELGFDLEKEAKKLRLTPYKIEIKKVKKQGITGRKVNITSLAKEEHHRTLGQIYGIIEKSGLDKDVKEKSKEVFLRLAKAESKVHGVPFDKARFHELGSVDSIVDITMAVSGVKKLGIEKIFASKLNLGSGFVKCAHGTFPVPAPATAELLKGIPVYSDGVDSELVTPTGAALISELAGSFGDMPLMDVKSIGYGAGYAELRHPNLLRVFLGESCLPLAESSDLADVIESNIDDINPEYYDHIIRKLLEEGALDVYITNIQMKKNRPGVKLSVISKPEKTKCLTDIIFRETSTFGVRIYRTRREKLHTEQRAVRTRYGTVNVRIGSSLGRVITVSPEYEDCRKIAEKKRIPIKKVYEEAKTIAQNTIKS